MALDTGVKRAPSRPIVRATVLSTALIGLGSVLGLGRDLTIASFFGADGSTDAFIVAWSVPETAVPLLIDGAMALLLVPAFVRALDKDNASGGPTTSNPAVADVVSAVLPRLLAVVIGVAAFTAAAAPVIVPFLAPGLADPELGIEAMRIVSLSLVFIGLAGFMAGALRAHMFFGPPAAIALMFNVGIVGTVLIGHKSLGILAAALGITIGSALMVAVQLPIYLRRIPIPRRRVFRTPLISLAAFVPIAVYTLTRQAQTYIERYFGSSLPPGTISHLNFAQKIGQLPTSLALILAVVTFPILARSVAAGDADQARLRTQADVRLIGAVVMMSVVFLFVFAPQVVALLFQRGAFTADDVVQTAAVLRVYVFGLLAQALVEVICRALFSYRATYLPVIMMGAGLVVTMIGSAIAAPIMGAPGIALGNALGITVTAILLLATGSTRNPAISLGAIGMVVLRLTGAAAIAAGGAGLLAAFLDGLPNVVVVATGGLSTALVFAVACVLVGVFPVPHRRVAAR